MTSCLPLVARRRFDDVQKLGRRRDLASWRVCASSLAAAGPVECRDMIEEQPVDTRDTDLEEVRRLAAVLDTKLGEDGPGAGCTARGSKDEDSSQ